MNLKPSAFLHSCIASVTCVTFLAFLTTSLDAAQPGNRVPGYKHLKSASFNGLQPAPFTECSGALYFCPSGGGLYELDQAGRIRQLWEDDTPVILAPRRMSTTNILLFLDDGRIMDCHLRTKDIMTVASMHASILLTSPVVNDRIALVTDDSILSLMDIRTGSRKFKKFADNPHSLTLDETTLAYTDSKGIRSVFNASNGKMMSLSENIPTQASVRAVDQTFIFDGKLLSRSGTNYSVEMEGCRRWIRTRLTGFNSLMIAHTETGDMDIMRKSSVKSTPRQWKTRHIATGRKGPSGEMVTRIEGTPSFMLSYGTGSFRFDFGDVDPSRIKDVIWTNLSPGPVRNCVILYDDNMVMRYTGIIILTFGPDTEPKVSKFLTIGDRDFNSIFPDLDKDGKCELLIRREMLQSYSRDVKKRILVPDIYTLCNSGYTWDSIRYPDFYSAEIGRGHGLKDLKPFKNAEWNIEWKTAQESLVKLQTTLITLHRQVQNMNSKSRDPENRKGLSLWFYKHGIEFYNNKWDNLALYAFKKSLETDKANKLAAFQITQIYLGYGLAADAYAAISGAGHERLPFLENQDYHVMRENDPQLVYEPAGFHRSYAMGMACLGSGAYLKGLISLERAYQERKNGDWLSRMIVTRSLAETYLLLNRNNMKAMELLNLLNSENPSRDLRIRIRTCQKMQSVR